MDESERDKKFWERECVKWKQLYLVCDDKYFDAVRELAAALGMDPEQTSMVEVVAEVGRLVQKNKELTAVNITLASGGVR